MKSLSRSLVPFRKDIWTLARPQRFFGIETGTRMTVVRLNDGGLFVHCPVALDPDLKKEIDTMGPVRAVVASSLFHHLYVGGWMQHYPEASFHPCPGLEKKRADLTWGPILEDAPSALWAADIDQAAFTARFEHEIVFLHRPTYTLISADALINLSTHPSLVTKVGAYLMGNNAPGKGFLEYIAVRDWKLGKKQALRILEWEMDGIVLAHGEMIEKGGRDVFAHAYSWLTRRGD